MDLSLYLSGVEGVSWDLTAHRKLVSVVLLSIVIKELKAQSRIPVADAGSRTTLALSRNHLGDPETTSPLSCNLPQCTGVLGLKELLTKADIV
jgi:hypothetical protein